jgi:hypothetical protein
MVVGSVRWPDGEHVSSVPADSEAEQTAAARTLTPDIALLLIGAAVRAPSLHNSQPWQFRYRADGGVELWADHRRALPATDPAGRELVISCGAALATLALGVRWLGNRPRIHRQPDPTRPALLARVELAEASPPSMVELDMFAAVLERHTHRGPFADVPIEPALMGSLRRLARRSGCRFHVITGSRMQDVARLSFTAQRTQRRQPAVQQELADWLRPAHGGHRDGVVVATTTAPSELGSRWSDPVRPPESSFVPTGQRSPATVLLTTHGDNMSAWLRTGEALQHILLHAASRGAHASFHTEVLEVPATRNRLAALTGGKYPQILMQLGYAESEPSAPRRAPTQVSFLP